MRARSHWSDGLAPPPGTPPRPHRAPGGPRHPPPAPVLTGHPSPSDRCPRPVSSVRNPYDRATTVRDRASSEIRTSTDTLQLLVGGAAAILAELEPWAPGAAPPDNNNLPLSAGEWLKAAGAGAGGYYDKSRFLQQGGDMPMVLGRRGALEGEQPLDFTVSKFSHQGRLLGGLFRLAGPASPPPGLQAPLPVIAQPYYYQPTSASTVLLSPRSGCVYLLPL